MTVSLIAEHVKNETNINVCVSAETLLNIICANKVIIEILLHTFANDKYLVSIIGDSVVEMR